MKQVWERRSHGFAPYYSPDFGKCNVKRSGTNSGMTELKR